MAPGIELLSGQPDSANTFGAVLAETLMEMEQAEMMDLVLEDAVQRLSLEAHQAVVSQTGGPLPRVGVHVYRETAVTPPASAGPGLDVRF